MKSKRIYVILMMVLLMFCMPVQAAAATPIIKETEAYPRTCYFHTDGKIYVYAATRYKADVKRAVYLLNKKYPVFQYTTYKTKRDVIIRDKKKPPRRTIVAVTTHYNGSITLYRSMMKRLTKKQRILTIAHELGHTAGLNHSSSRKSLMYGWIDRMKAKGLSKADVRALKKAKKASKKETNYRKRLTEAFLAYEKYNKIIHLDYGPWILLFPVRGTTYKSSNSKVLKAYPTGYLMARKSGKATLTVKNAGVVHTFKIRVR